jgi:hypothetical protein
LDIIMLALAIVMVREFILRAKHPERELPWQTFTNRHKTRKKK